MPSHPFLGHPAGQRKRQLAAQICNSHVPPQECIMMMSRGHCIRVCACVTKRKTPGTQVCEARQHGTTSRVVSEHTEWPMIKPSGT